MRKAESISYVVPVFNEELNIKDTTSRILRAFEGNGVAELEIIYIDDGSKDESYSIIQSLCINDARIKCIRLARNYGHQAALTAGLKAASHDVIAILDGDLQDPPEVINEFIERYEAGYDVVYGVRRKRKESIWKRVSYFSFYRLLRAMSSIDIPLDSGDFCLISSEALSLLNGLPEVNRYIRGLRTYVGLNQIGVPYERSARCRGESKYSFRALLRLASDGIFNFSDRPIKLATMLGFSTSFISILGAILFSIWRATELEVMGHTAAEIPGYASIIFSIFFLSGVQLFTIGIIGEYIARIFIESKKRPSYLIRNTVNFG